MPIWPVGKLASLWTRWIDFFSNRNYTCPSWSPPFPPPKLGKYGKLASSFALTELAAANFQMGSGGGGGEGSGRRWWRYQQPKGRDTAVVRQIGGSFRRLVNQDYEDAADELDRCRGATVCGRLGGGHNEGNAGGDPPLEPHSVRAAFQSPTRAKIILPPPSREGTQSCTPLP